MAQELSATVATNVTAGLPSASAQDTITVLKPRDGQTVIVDAGRFSNVKFNFALTDVQVRVVGVDLILVFEDGSKIVLPSMALDLSAPEAPQLYFGDEVVPPEVLFSDIGVVQIAENVSNLALTNVTTTNAVAEADAQPQPQPTPTLEGADSAGDTRGQIGEPPVLSQAAPVTPPSVTPAPAGAAASASTADAENTFTSNAVASTDSRLKSFEAPQLFSYGNFGPTGAAATAGVKQAQPGVAALTTTDFIAGSGDADRLVAEDSSAAGVGNSVATARLTLKLEDAAVEKGVVTLTLTNGFRLLTNGYIQLVEGSDNTKYTIDVSSESQDLRYLIKDGFITLDLPLVYRVPTGVNDKVDANGFYTDYEGTVSASFKADGATGGSDLSDTLTIGVRNVGSDDSRLSFKATENGGEWLVLLDKPAGNLIVAGGGNDTIFAGAGADNIDGGDDFDTVSYAYSGAGVSIQLRGSSEAIIADTGFARGDKIRNVEALIGSIFADTLKGDGNANSLIGNGGDDLIEGGGGADTIRGVAGTVVGSTDADTLSGGEGADVYLVTEQTGTIVERYDNGEIDTVIVDPRTAETGFTLGGGLTTPDNLNGTDFVENLVYTGTSRFTGVGNWLDNTITSSTGQDLLNGGDGNDSLSSGGENDTIFGGAGNDSLFGGDGEDRLEGGDGNDSLVGNLGDDRLFGNAGNDTLDGGNDGGNTVYGGAGDDLYLIGADTSGPSSLTDTSHNVVDDSGHDTIRTGVATFRLTEAKDVENLEFVRDTDHTGSGNALANSITGAGGNDILAASYNFVVADGQTVASNTGDTLNGGLGNDRLLAADGNNDNLSGGGGNDTLIGASGADTLDGGADADSLVGGGGADSLYGGAGLNTVEGGAGDDRILGGADGDIIYGGASALATGTGNDTIVAAAAADTIFGQDGADDIQADGGANSVDGGLGADTIVALAGDDRIEGGADGDRIDGGAGNNLLYGGYAAALATGTGNDTILGGSGADTIYGADGADSLDGRAGADSVMGEAGADTIVGNFNNTVDGGTEDDVFLLRTAGNASLVGGAGTDEVRIEGPLTSDAAGNGEVRSFSLGGTKTTGVEKLTYTGTGAFSLAGDDFANTITGGSGGNSLAGGGGTDSLVGGGGNDTLDGGTGADSMAGGAGNDLYLVDALGDVVMGTGGAAGDVGGSRDEIRTSLNSYTLAGGANVEVLSYSGTGGYTANGNAADQTFVSSAGDDSINGGGGTGDALYVNLELNDNDIEEIRKILTLGSSESYYTTALGGPDSRPLFDITGKLIASGFGFTLNATKTTFILNSIGAGTGTDTLSQVKYIIFNNAVLKLNSGAAFAGDQDGDPTKPDVLPPFGSTLLGSTSRDDLLGAASNAGGTALADDLYGGQGNDTYVFNNRDDAASELVTPTALAGSTNDTVILTREFAESNTFGNSFSIAAAKGNGGAAREFDNFTTVGGSTGIENLIYEGATAYSLGGNGLNNLIRSTNTSDSSGGADTLFGAAGNDTLDGGVGADSLIGGTGNDVFVVDNAGDVVVEASGSTSGVANGTADEIWITSLASGGGFSLNGQGGDTRFLNVENARLQNAAGEAVTSGFYTVVGDDGANILVGGGAGSAASLVGGLGNDALTSRGGADILSGGTGNDLYTISGGASNLGNGGVTITGEATGTGNTFADTVSTSLSSFDLSLSTGGDGLANIEVLSYSGAGAFTGTGHSGANTLTGANGAAGSSVNLIGGGGRDSLIGGNGADTLDAASFETELTGNATTLGDTLSGGAGNDWYIINTAGDLIVNEVAGTGDNFIDTIQIQDAGLVTATTSGQTTAGTTLVNQTYALEGRASNVENLVYNGTLNVTLAGNTLNNSIQGGSGNDSLSGNTGVSTSTSEEYDILAGGLGNDTYFVDSGNDTVVENADAGTDRVSTSLAAYTLAANVENLTTTNTTTGSYLTGNALANTITGSSGADTLDGGADAAIDSLVGGTGSDYYILRSASAIDAFTDSGGAADTVELRFNPGAALSLNVNNVAAGLNLSGIENLFYEGASAITVTGGQANNYIKGNAGTDSISGGTDGADTLEGREGNDSYFISSASYGAGARIVESATNGGADTVSTSGAYTFDLGSGRFDNVEALVSLNASSAFTGIGNSLANIIVGGNGVNSLVGGGGADSILGGSADDRLDGVTSDLTGSSMSADTLIGGAGDDTYLIDYKDFVVEGAGIGGQNRVAAGDTIEISGTGIAANKVLSWSLDQDYDSKILGVQQATMSSEGNVKATGFTGVENLTYTGSSAFSAVGNNGNNVIIGGSGSNTLIGGIGMDTLVGGSAADRLEATNVSRFGNGLTSSWANAVNSNTANLTTSFVKSQAFTMSVTVEAFRDSGRDFLALGASDLTAGSSNNSLNASAGTNGVVLGWVAGYASTGFETNTITLYMFGGQAYKLTAIKDSGTHTLALTYDGTTPTLYIDGVAQTWTTIGTVGTVVPTDPVAQQSFQIMAGYAGSVLDNAQVYTTALTAAEIMTIAKTPDAPLGATSPNSGSLVAFYDFNTGLTNGAPGADSSSDLTLSSSGYNFRGGQAMGPSNGGSSLSGGGGNDTLLGGTGMDTLDGGTGNDSMMGAAGNDLYYISDAGDRVSDSGGTDTILIRTTPTSGVVSFVGGTVGANGVEAIGVDTAAYSATGDESTRFSISGANSATSIWGWTNADTLVGGNAADTLYGNGFTTTQAQSEAIDSLMGGAGNDLYYIDQNDIVDDKGTGATEVDSVVLSATSAGSYTLNVGNTSGIENLTVSGDGTFGSTIWGSVNANDTISHALGGAAGNDFIQAYGGADTLVSNGGADTLDGGLGNDVYRVQGVADETKITFIDGGGTDTIRVDTGGSFDLSKIKMLDADGNALTPTADNRIENLSTSGGSATLIGDQFNNSFSGSGVADVIRDGGGADTIVAGLGSDTVQADLDSFIANMTIGGDRYDLSTGPSDTFALYNSGTVTGQQSITGSQFANNLKETEVLDFTGSGVDIFTTINASNISQIAFGSTLKILSNANDTINLTQSGNYTSVTFTQGSTTTKHDFSDGPLEVSGTAYGTYQFTDSVTKATQTIILAAS